MGGETMMFRKILFLLSQTMAFLMLISAMSASAADIDIYTNSGEGVEPNILIIFDNSGSMNDQIQVAFYDPAYDYYTDALAEQGWGYDHDKVYYYSRGSWNHIFKESTSQIPCDSARNALNTRGFFNGRIRWSGTCGGPTKRYLRTGNYLNYLASIGGSQTRTKLEIAKEVVQDFVMTTYDVRMGAMIFNHSEGGRIHHDSTLDYHTFVRDMGDDESDPAYANREALRDALLSIQADTWTPLAETLYEAGLYFQGAASYFNTGVTYTTPITDWCQKNYVILITDGESTQDRNAVLQTLGSSGDTDGDGHEPGGSAEIPYESEGSDYLDDVAKYLYDTDLMPSLQERQNIVTYTIGFAIDTQLLQDTAETGHGTYHTSNTARELSDVFQQIIQEILETSSSFTAPVVPISQMEKTTSGSKIYLALFKTSEDAFWKGNIKKFSIATQATGDIDLGDVLDVNGNPATDDQGCILDEAVSFWGSSEPDGGDTEAGGVGQVLLDRTTPRNIYTYLGSQSDLTETSNAFNNSNILPAMVGLDPADTSGRDDIVNFVYGQDAYDEDGDLNFTEKRHWILGAFLHSRPAVVHYDETTSVIFAGANDGMLHAFLDSDGSELWAFIPPDQLAKLPHLSDILLEYFVDGSPRATVIDQDMDGVVEPADGDQVILVFSERRGGSYYYALDVTYPEAPVFLWEIHPQIGGDFAELGQTWSSPVIGKVRIGAEDRLVLFLGGGYDPNQDDDPVVESDAMGRGIHVVDLFDGSLVWKHTYADDPDMTFCMPGDMVALNINDDTHGYVDRLYAGDAGGRIWRCDIGDPNPTSWSARLIFDDSTGGRKIFYPPDVVFEHDCEMLFWGTGDRANPKNETIINRIYALKDRGSLTPLTPADLYDATQNLVQDGAEAEQEAALISLASLDGWYVELDEHVGEKVLAPSIVYAGAVYLTTFTPTAGSEIDPCYVGEGMARLYALDYLTAAAVLNFDTSTEDLHKSDRYQLIGTAIPSGVVIAIIQGKGASYIGVGGGIFTADMLHPSAILRIYWRMAPEG